MNPLAAFLLAVFALLAIGVGIVSLADPPEPVLLVDAAAPSSPHGGLFLIVPPSLGRAIWCQQPARPSDGISRT